MIPKENGPINEYCRATGCSVETAGQKLEDGDTNITIIFAAEVLYGLLSDINDHLEVLEMSSDA